MRMALDLAAEARERGEVPVGAVVVVGGKAVGRGRNCPVTTSDPTAHAEMIAITQAATSLENCRLEGTEMYVTLEPCTMCAGAMIHARIARLVFGAYDPRTGAIESVANILDQPHHNHRLDYLGGVLEGECSLLLKTFFERKRLKK